MWKVGSNSSANVTNRNEEPPAKPAPVASESPSARPTKADEPPAALPKEDNSTRPIINNRTSKVCQKTVQS